MADVDANDGPPRPPDERPNLPPPAGTVPTTPPESTLDEQVARLIKERGYLPEVARKLAESWHCEECDCAVGAPRKDDCECPCHCDCCCEGLFRCYVDCPCEHDCHYDPNAPSEHGSEEEKAPTSANREPAQPLDQPAPAGSGKEESKQEDTADGDGDDNMQGKSLETWTLGELYEHLGQQLSTGMSDEDSEAAVAPLALAFFTRIYNETLKTGLKAKKESALPALQEDEMASLLAYMRILLDKKQATLQRFTAAIKEIVLTTFRSTWTLERILKSRRDSATAPASAGPNAWSQKTPTVNQAKLEADMAKFRFDTTVYSTEEITRLKKLCGDSYSFADTTRKPEGDEWTIMMGIMSGTIAVRSLPQFLKRCCNMSQFQWFHFQMIRRAEGELYVQLPPSIKIYDYNQTAKRLADVLLMGAETQKMDPAPLQRMLQTTKTISYNDDLKTIHFFFDTKMEAIQWEDTEVPLRRMKLKLKNPDARYREIRVEPSGERKIVIRPPRDGLQDNRYDSHYKLRLTNITRTMEVDKLAQFLKELTSDGILMGAPIDAYGANSEYSLTWDFLARTHICPPALAKVNRIMWRDHAILIIHQGRAAAAPCHQCAAIGHQASACPKKNAAEWYTESTIRVTDEMIVKIHTDRRTWTTQAEARQLFDALGDKGTTPEQPTQGPESTSTEDDAPTSADQVKTSEKDDKTPDNIIQHDNTKTSNPTDPEATPTGGAISNEKDNTSTAHQITTPDKNNTQPNSTASNDGKAWTTVTSKHQHTKNPEKENKDEMKTPSTGPDTPRNSGSRFDAINVDDDDDDDADEDGTEQTTGTTKDQEPASNPTPRGQEDGQPERPPDDSARHQNRRKKTAKMTKRDEYDSITESINRANMQRVSRTIQDKMAQTSPRLNSEDSLKAIRLAREDRERITSSLNGTIEAVNGKLINTPPTGNCLYMAIAETLSQRAFASNKGKEELTELTMLVKLLIYLANKVDSDVEMEQTNALAVLDGPIGEFANLDPAALKAKIDEQYANIATSPSDSTFILDRALWGHTDCLRLVSKGLGRKIFVISNTKDPAVVSHTMFQPQRIRVPNSNSTVPSATLHQPGYQAWLAAVQQDIEAGLTPLIISFTTNHYNAVLLNRDQDDTMRKIPTKNQTLQQVWSAPNTKGLNAVQTQLSKPSDQDPGPTSKQLVASQSTIETSDIFNALGQDNWTREEKEIAIVALVRGRERLKELLAFSGEATPMSDEDSDDDNPSDAEMSPRSSTSDSTFVPSQGQYVFSAPPASVDFSGWTQDEWYKICEDWAGQDGVRPPALDDRAVLAKFAAKYPEVMGELTRNHPDPFAVLDHMEDQGLRGWFAVKRLDYCADELTKITAGIEDSHAQQLLSEWIKDTRATAKPSDRTTKYRAEGMWTLLGNHAKTEIQTRPLLARNFNRNCLYVMALDELFPSLASDISDVDGYHTGMTDTLIQVYERRGAFHAAVQHAIDGDTWEPLRRYVQAVGTRLSLSQRPAGTPTRC